MRRGKVFFNIMIGIMMIALISMASYVAYYYVSNYLALKEAEEAVEEFEKEVMVVELEEPEVQENGQAPTTSQNPTKPTTNAPKKTSNTSYRNYAMIGTIQIPKTKVKAPIVDKVTPKSIAAAVGTLYGPGLNQVGNTVLAAHNYRNRNIFFQQ